LFPYCQYSMKITTVKRNPNVPPTFNLVSKTANTKNDKRDGPKAQTIKRNTKTMHISVKKIAEGLVPFASSILVYLVDKKRI